VQATTTRPKIIVTADGAGVVSYVGSRLLGDVADRTTLTGELSAACDGLRRLRIRHDPGRVLVDPRPRVRTRGGPGLAGGDGHAR